MLSVYRWESEYENQDFGQMSPGFVDKICLEISSVHILCKNQVSMNKIYFLKKQFTLISLLAVADYSL